MVLFISDKKTHAPPEEHKGILWFSQPLTQNTMVLSRLMKKYLGTLHYYQEIPKPQNEVKGNHMVL